MAALFRCSAGGQKKANQRSICSNVPDTKLQISCHKRARHIDSTFHIKCSRFLLIRRNEAVTGAIEGQLCPMNERRARHVGQNTRSPVSFCDSGFYWFEKRNLSLDKNPRVRKTCSGILLEFDWHIFATLCLWRTSCPSIHIWKASLRSVSPRPSLRVYWLTLHFFNTYGSATVSLFRPV